MRVALWQTPRRTLQDNPTSHPLTLPWRGTAGGQSQIAVAGLTRQWILSFVWWVLSTDTKNCVLIMGVPAQFRVLSCKESIFFSQLFRSDMKASMFPPCFLFHYRCHQSAVSHRLLTVTVDQRSQSIVATWFTPSITLIWFIKKTLVRAQKTKAEQWQQLQPESSWIIQTQWIHVCSCST